MTDFKPGDKALVVVEVWDSSPSTTWLELGVTSDGSPYVDTSDLTPVPSVEDVADVIGRYLYLEVSDMDAADVIAREVLALFGVGVES